MPVVFLRDFHCRTAAIGTVKLHLELELAQAASNMK
jgi:hypothetical protein